MLVRPRQCDHVRTGKCVPRRCHALVNDLSLKQAGLGVDVADHGGSVDGGRTQGLLGCRPEAM